jgi:hypothetical protein
MHCAQANEITDGVRWDILINCHSNNIINAFIGLESNAIPKHCNINFLYSGNSDDLKKPKCHFPLIDTCPEYPEFQMPDGVRLSKNDIVSLCTSGLMSPYRAIKMYANVFCHFVMAKATVVFLFCLKLP